MDEGQRKEWLSKLEGLEDQLLDLRSRWPAHSLKPAMLIELETLEEERDYLRDLLKIVDK